MDTRLDISSALPRPEVPSQNAASPARASGFSEVLQNAFQSVDQLQHQSEAQQVSYAKGEPVELHDVLLSIEEAELAFKTMMEVRNKLLESYNEVMRMGSGG